MLMAHWVWVLEEFDRVSGKLRSRRRLADLSDEEARLLVGLAELGDGDLYDLPNASLSELSARYGLKPLPEKFEYLLGRESLEPS
jgi:hypothetical protein